MNYELMAQLQIGCLLGTLATGAALSAPRAAETAGAASWGAVRADKRREI